MLDTLILGWKEVKDWSLLSGCWRRKKRTAINILVLDGVVVELLWPDTINTNNNNGQKYPTIGSALTDEEKLVIADLIKNFTAVFLEEFGAGRCRF